MVFGSALLAAATPPSTSGDPVVLWLGPFDAGALDGAALLDAVSVYTRDLNLETRTALDVPLPTPAALAAGMDAAAGAAIQGRGGRLGFWCAPSPDAKTTALIIVDGQGRLEVRLVDSAGLDGPELSRAIALKLRAVLAATIGPEAVAASPAAPVVPPGVTVTTPGTPVAPVVPPVPGGAVSLTATPLPVANGRRRLFAALGYRISAPLGSGSIQQGAAGEAGVRLGRAVELALGVALETRTSDGGSAGTVSVRDLPIDLEARLVQRGQRFSWGGGGFASAHLLWATATAAAGAEQTSFALSGGVGVAALARGVIGRGVAGEARLYAELAVPSTSYWVRGTPVLELGPRVGLGIALCFPAP